MINKERLLRIIQKPYISEKTTFVESVGHYVFKVNTNANKLDIKKAIELLFKVKVIAVRICNIKGKPKGFGRISKGYRKDWKKAYIQLQEGQKIDFEAINA